MFHVKIIKIAQFKYLVNNNDIKMVINIWSDIIFTDFDSDMIKIAFLTIYNFSNLCIELF